jgi:hypothetical protein
MLLRLAVVLVPAIACALQNRISQGGSPSALDNAVYRAYLEAFARRTTTDTLYFEELSGLIPNCATLRERLGSQFDSLPSSLRVALPLDTLQNRLTMSLQLSFPTRTIFEPELKQLFDAEADSGWARFYRLHPNTKGYARISHVVYSSDRQNAAFYYEYLCGGLCGSGQFVWLSQSTGSDKWLVRHVYSIWIS